MCALIAALAVTCATARSVSAQASGNTGALTLTGGLDVPTVYIYRGIVQEGDPKLTLTPFGDVGIRLTSADGSPGSVRLNVGAWNSLNTGSSGTGGPLKALHATEQFYTTLTLGLGKGFLLTPGYRANTSPNGGYNTIKEATLEVAAPGRLAPYGLLAFELSDGGQLDGGSKKGTYLEVGANPAFGLPFWHLTVTVPAKAGFSLSNYYELFDSTLTYHDHQFGFFDIGGMVTLPLSGHTSRFGSWGIHGGAEVLAFGDTTRAFNRGEKTKVVASAGVSFKY